MRSCRTLLFIAKHTLVLLLSFLVAAGAGRLVARDRGGLAFRCALGLAVVGHILFFFALAGQLRIGAVLVLLLAVAGFRERPPLLLAVFAVPLFLLAIFPAVEFDETMYHLPFIHDLAMSGEMRFLPELRFPAFPRLQELLGVPAYLFAGDAAPHLISLLEILVAAGVAMEWARRHEVKAGPLAAALFLGSPIIIHLATIAYVEPALLLFVTAGLYCLDRAMARAMDSATAFETDAEPRWWFAMSGFFLGSACSVKYLAGAFVVAGFLVAMRRKERWFFVGGLFAAVPMTLNLIALTGNPLFPFATRIFGTSSWALTTLPLPSMGILERLLDVLRFPFDVTFARARVNQQPHYTPLFIPMLAIVLVWIRDARVRFVALLTLVMIAIFTFLPRDSRYLTALLPALSVTVAVLVVRRLPRIATVAAIVAVLPGLAYAGYRLAKQGFPPIDVTSRRAYLEQKWPELHALERVGTERVYACGAEQLRYWSRADLIGDYFGLYRHLDVVGPAMAVKVQKFGARYVLVSKQGCSVLLPQIAAAPGLERIYEDEAAILWRVNPAR